MRRVHILCMLALLSSCAPRRSEILLNTRETPPAVLVSAVEERRSRIVSLTGSGVLTFDSPELSGNASFESTMKKPDSLLVTLEGPFGIDVGTFFLSRVKYVMYNSLENTVVTGTPSGSSIRSVIPFDLTHEQILNAFAGVFDLPVAERDLKSYAIVDDQFFLSSACGLNTCRYWIDPRYLLVTRYEITDEKNEIVVEARASSFSEQNGVVAARRISFSFPKENRQLSVTYSTLELNPAEPDFRFSIPSSARKISRP